MVISNFRFLSWFRGVIIAVLIVITSMVSFADTAHAGLVIRGGKCSAQGFISGAESTQPVSKKDTYITGLSVNFTDETSKKQEFAQYQPLTQNNENFDQYCVSTSDQIIKKGGKLTPAPLEDNPFHYLLDGKAGEIAKVLTKYPM